MTNADQISLLLSVLLTDIEAGLEGTMTNGVVWKCVNWRNFKSVSLSVCDPSIRVRVVFVPKSGDAFALSEHRLNSQNQDLLKTIWLELLLDSADLAEMVSGLKPRLTTPI